MTTPRPINNPEIIKFILNGRSRKTVANTIVIKGDKFVIANALAGPINFCD